MSLYQDLRAWEEKLAALLEEARQLSERVAQMERQNQQLQESHVRSSYDSGGLSALQDLYNEGFHVCHAHFAESREEDCLFCLSLLYRSGRENALTEET
ncbi:MAG: initiation control protein YabA [Clostridiales bacterium]|nr:initiation control protein YabA [Clostridiales bacterium]